MKRSIKAMYRDCGRHAPAAAALTAVLLWGGSFAAMKTAVTGLDAWAVMWARMSVGALLLLPFAGRLFRFSGYRKGDWKLLALLASLQPCLYFIFEARALTLTTSSQAGVISASVPLLVAVGACLALGERLSAKTLAGLFLAMLGVAWLSLAAAPNETAPNPLLGNLLELCAMVCAAAYMILLKRLSGRYGAWTLTALQTFTGALFFLPGALPFFERGLSAITGAEAFSLLYLGAGATLGAFGLYNWGLSRMPAGKGSSFINLVPVSAAALGWLLLGETLSPAQGIAAVAVLFGVRLSQAGYRSSAADAPSIVNS